MSHGLLSQEKLVTAIVRLWARVAGQRSLAGVSHTVGTSIIVGIKTFNIVGG